MLLGPLNAGNIHAFLIQLPQRRHFSQPVDMLHAQIYCKINLFFGGEPANAKADGGMSQVLYGQRHE